MTDPSISIRPEVLDTGFVRIIIRILPGWQWWECPPTAELRRIAHRTARDAGLKLVKGEPRQQVRMHPHWCFLYRTEPA